MGAVAVRSGAGDTTGPSVWLGQSERGGRLESLSRWVETWPDNRSQELPEDLRGAVLGIGPPVRLAPLTPDP